MTHIVNLPISGTLTLDIEDDSPIGQAIADMTDAEAIDYVLGEFWCDDDNPGIWNPAMNDATVAGMGVTCEKLSVVDKVAAGGGVWYGPGAYEATIERDV